MNHIRSRANICPEVLSLYHFKSDEQKRLAYEYKSCQLLLEKLTTPSPNNSTIKHRVQALRNHIAALEGTFSAPPQLLTPQDALQTLQKIEQIRALSLSKTTSKAKEMILPVINSLPKQVRNYLEGMVYSYHPQRKSKWQWGRHELQANPHLLFSLKDTQGTPLIVKLERLARAHFSFPVQLDLHQYLGAQLDRRGVVFRVFAPHAKHVALKLTYDGQQPSKMLPMKQLPETGVWEIRVDGVKDGQSYLFSVEGTDGHTRLKSDPFAVEIVERRKNGFRHESIVRNKTSFIWQDSAWVRRREQTKSIMNIYELHPTAWIKDKEKKPLNYRQLALQLVKYCRAMNYTHVELMGLLSHPCQSSMGYQVTNYFSPNARLGTLNDLKAFVNYLHRSGIGVVLDFSSAHFAIDKFGLEQFDGTSLFEKIYPLYKDRDSSFHPKWKSYEFKFDSSWVRDFLSSCVSYWAEELHIDAFRFDAVSNSIAKNYARDWGHYLPNHRGGHEDDHGKEFFRAMNAAIHARDPNIVLIAENSAYSPSLKKQASAGGLEFDLDWNFSRQADFLHFFRLPFDKRAKEWHRISNAIKADGRSSLTVSSHDEFSHGKKSLPNKMPGSTKEKFAGCRLYHSMLYSVPGRGVLTCMGTEFAQPHEWSHGFIHPKTGVSPVEWNVLNQKTHRGVQLMVKELASLYVREPSLHSSSPVKHIDTSDNKNCVARYIRHVDGGKRLLFIHNFGTNDLRNYRVPVYDGPVQKAKELFNSECLRFGGSGITNTRIIPEPNEIRVNLAPLSTIIVELDSVKRIAEVSPRETRL